MHQLFSLGLEEILNIAQSKMEKSQNSHLLNTSKNVPVPWTLNKNHVRASWCMDKLIKAHMAHVFYISEYTLSPINLQGSLFFSLTLPLDLYEAVPFMVESHLENYNGSSINQNICPAQSECNSSWRLTGQNCVLSCVFMARTEDFAFPEEEPKILQNRWKPKTYIIRSKVKRVWGNMNSSFSYLL